MCGISALFSKQPSKKIVKSIVDMTSIVRHRGPDDEGFIFFSNDTGKIIATGGLDTPQLAFNSQFNYAPGLLWKELHDVAFDAALGHRRLSIVDLSPAGHQPMCTEDGRFWITYNGEVYNYIEIRKTLESLGYSFLTNTDTEVILKAFQAWGLNSFKHFNGMFAFVIFDRIKRTVVAVRDRFGVKPLYYWRSPEGTIAFASEIKQFTQLPGWSAVMNGQRIYDFLNLGISDHTEETCFANVHQLRGGEYLTFSLIEFPAQLKPESWYSLTPTKFEGSLQDAANHFRELLKNAIELRLRADVDIGSCLSGGLDSSSIVCLANKCLNGQQVFNKQKTFSACSDVKQYDERSFIDIIVSATGVDAHYAYPKLDNLFEDCREVIWHQDEPFASTSIYAQWLVFKLSKECGVKVMLDGQGADEHLAGYHGFFGNRFYDLFRSFQWRKLLKELRITKSMHPSLNPESLFLGKLVPDFCRLPLRRMLGKSAPKPDWLNLELLNAIDCIPNFQQNHRTVLDQSKQQLSHTSLPMLLHWEDRDSMAHSIESRTPFLDYRLVEFTLGLSSEYKISDGWTKRVLRESMKGILPEEVRRRVDKIGFATAEEDWLKRQAPKLFQQALLEAIEKSKGILLPSSTRLLGEMIEGKRPFSFLPWRLIILGYWIDRFSVSSPST